MPGKRMQAAAGHAAATPRRLAKHPQLRTCGYRPVTIPHHPSFRSARAGQAVLRYSLRCIERWVY